MRQDKWRSQYFTDISLISHPISLFFLNVRRLELYKYVHFTFKFKINSAFQVMKSKDLQKVVLSKYQKGDTPTQIYRDLNGGIGLRTVERWCQMIRRSGSITLSKPPGCPRLIRTKDNIQKVKHRLRRKK